jgi:D-proline reductase (dithiol) PrdB
VEFYQVSGTVIMTNDIQIETWQHFKDSFAYGSRTDLNFKFLKALSDEDAAKFLQDLLWKLGDACDDGNLDRLVAHISEGQIQAYSGDSYWKYDEGPFAPVKKPIAESRLALLTSSGHFVKGDDPEPFGVKDMTQEEATERIAEFLQAEPQLSVIPVDTPRDRLGVRHGGYDTRGAQVDPNVVFPHERLLELENEGIIGELAPQAYSFVGACAQTRLLKQAGPQWVELLQEQQIDTALLVPV